MRISRETSRSMDTAGSSRRPRDQRPRVREAGDGRGRGRRREADVRRGVRVVGKGTRRAPMGPYAPPERDCAVRIPWVPDAETRGMEVHEPRAASACPIQARHLGAPGWGPRGEAGTLHLRRPEDEPGRLRERAVRAPTILPAILAGRRPDRVSGGDAAFGTEGPRETRGSPCGLAGR